MTGRIPNAAAFVQGMVDCADDAVVIYNPDKSIVSWNRVAEQMLGFSTQETIGQSIEILVPPTQLDEEREAMDLIAQGDPISGYRTHRRRKDGEIIKVVLSVAPVRDETGKFIGGIQTIRPQSLFPLSPELLLSSFVESADDAIVTKTLDGIVTSWNPGAERIFGYSAAEMIGRSIALLIPINQPDEEPRILRRIRAGERIDHYETKRQTKDGRIIDISLTVSPIRDSTGTIVGASKIARDITERKRLEAREREAKRQAEALSRAKDDFIATVSHELRTPMTAILGWVRMLSGGGLGSEAQKKALQVIERNAKSQAQLIEDLLDMSRIVSGKLKLKMKPVDAASIIAAVVESLRPTAETKSIRVQMVIDSSITKIIADEDRLRQVIWNLLSNALKFTSVGGRIQISLDRIESGVRIAVHDNGIGIAPDFLPYVFNRFSQADSSITRAHGGLGMGLSIVKSIVELHGGEVNVSSPGEGKGATFTVMLPAAPTASRRQEESPPTAALLDEPLLYSRDLVGLKLLVVDDELDTCEMLSFLLERCGAEVQTANSAVEALEMLKIWSPDVLICDIGMPSIDGYELIRRIRADASLRSSRIPAVALTALARIEDRVKALSAGYQMHVAKPIEPVELVSLIASVASLGGKGGV